MEVDQAKANGVHYTPPELATFLAEVVAERLSVGTCAVKILDPACGHGALLFAFSQAVPSPLRKRLVLYGYETDEAALRQAAGSLAGAGVGRVVLQRQDFLAIEGIEGMDVGPRRGQLSLLDDFQLAASRQFDAVIANPPYVRTQVLGAAAARELARRFRLTGRVDLYHAFTKAMANVLKSGGVLGLLTSNRFLTVRSGASLRRLLRTEFDLEAIYDLGDTKLFTAAVLPVIVVARKQRAGNAHRTTNVKDREVLGARQRPTAADPSEPGGSSHRLAALPPCVFDRVYEHRPNGQASAPDHECAGVLAAFRDHTVKGLVRTEKGTFKIERGVLEAADDDEPWSLSTADYREWLDRLQRQRRCAFDDVANIRVGIKTTADEVFIRDDWESLPERLQPEAELLRPLITHLETQRWIPTAPQRKVLYTHAVQSGKRVPIRLEDYPRARAYLESHKERLSGRRYVLAAGRQWYEIWVPQNPRDWSKPKIAFSDISEQPRFCLDPSGAIVNGDCYWMTLRPGFKPDWLLLLLAVANSSFATRYYDIAFHNKLYAGRRRFMTQYVKKFPLPPLEAPIAQRIVQLVGARIAGKTPDDDHEREIERLVWQSFGLAEEG
ncbi:MAG: N-6 DNA methylase [Thermoguttaceae bacterium]|jgi:tRNA1(Val) A37 N6-methylase TrmN6